MTFAFTFCPQCGSPLAEQPAFGRPRRYCRFCGFIQFRDPKVAVGALISDGSRVLLVRRSAQPAIGFWALPAGFMDHDEMPEEALAREVLEETGLEVRLLGLMGIVPMAGWNEKRGILLVYAAEPTGGQMLAADDVSDARWFTPAELPWDEVAFDSTAEFLREWASRQPRDESS